MGISHELQYEIEQFLYHEAALLDERRFNEWLDLLTEDFIYQMPVRLTREAGQTEELSMDMMHFDDDKHTLTMRVVRLQTDYAWAEDPPSRTRHLVTNVRVRPGEQADEYLVNSNYLIYRNRGLSETADLIAGEKQDVIRKVGDSFKLVKRLIVVDQSVLGTRNLAIFI